jgi:hypothetical protein
MLSDSKKLEPTHVMYLNTREIRAFEKDLKLEPTHVLYLNLFIWRYQIAW